MRETKFSRLMDIVIGVLEEKTKNWEFVKDQDWVLMYICGNIELDGFTPWSTWKRIDLEKRIMAYWKKAYKRMGKRSPLN